MNNLTQRLNDFFLLDNFDISSSPERYEPRKVITPIFENMCSFTNLKNFKDIHINTPLSRQKLTRTLVLCNHQSGYDITLLSDLLRNFSRSPLASDVFTKWIAKPTLPNLLTYTGCMPFISKRDLKKLKYKYDLRNTLLPFNQEVLPDLITHSLKSVKLTGNERDYSIGHNLVSFPEGTRNSNGDISSISPLFLNLLSNSVKDISDVNVLIVGINYHEGAQMYEKLSGIKRRRQDVIISTSDLIPMNSFENEFVQNPKLLQEYLTTLSNNI